MSDTERYIDADELIKVLQEWRDTSSLNDGAGNPVDSILYDVIRHIENAPTADVAPRAEWISVAERLPLNFESVLVLATSRREDDGYDVLIAYHDRGEWEERSVHGDGGTVYAHVKYWMPLPEPPKGE